MLRCGKLFRFERDNKQPIERIADGTTCQEDAFNKMQYFRDFKFPFYLSVLTTLLSMLTGGCTQSPSTVELKSAFENAIPYYSDDAINLFVTTSVDLNSYHNQPNSCSLLIIQSDNRGVLDTLISDADLLQGVFNGEQKSPGVLQINRYFLMPGEIIRITLPRVERAQYVAVIAGYYPSPGPEYSFVSPIPLKLNTKGWFFPDYYAEYQPLHIYLKLGRLNVTQIKFTPRGDQYLLMSTKTNQVSSNGTEKSNSGSLFTEKINKIVSDDIENMGNMKPNGEGK